MSTFERLVQEIMKRFAFVLFFCVMFADLYSQRRFIKTDSDVGFGNAIRIIPARDDGWIIASMDSMRIAGFDKCGKKLWSKKYALPNEEPLLNDIIALRSGNFILLTRVSGAMDYVCLITCLDTSGDILWSKSFEDSYYEQYGYTLSEDLSGNMFLYANTEPFNSAGIGYNMVCKFNSSGNILWTKFYDHGGIYGGAIVTSDQGMLLRTGNMFMKTDPGGNILWTSAGSSPGTYHYTAPVEVSDGYIFANYKTGSNRIVIYKIDRQGNFTQGMVKVLNYTGDYPRLKVTPSGTVAGISNVGSYPVIFEFDKDLNPLRNGAIDYNGQTLVAKDFCFSGGEAIVAGVTGNSQMFFAKLDDLYKSSCDVTLPVMQMQDDTIYHMIHPTVVTSHTLTEVNHSYNFTNVLDEVYTACTVPLQLDLGPDITICNFSSQLLRNNLLGLFNEYHWSTGEKSPYINVSQPGKYWVEAIQFCEDSIVRDTVTISVDSVPQADWQDAIYECENSPIVLHAPSCNQCSYQWSTGETSDSVIISQTGRYSLIVENTNNCQSYDSIDVNFGKCECDFYVPNSFTPNNDGINEVFKPVYYCELINYEIRIFNRMGKLVYSSTNSEEGWNGYTKNTAGIEDIYNYTIQYTPVIKGKATANVSRSGMVALIY